MVDLSLPIRLDSFISYSGILPSCLHVGELCEGAINLGLILINLENTTHLGERFSSKVIDILSLNPAFLCEIYCRLDGHLRQCSHLAQVVSASIFVTTKLTTHESVAHSEHFIEPRNPHQPDSPDRQRKHFRCTQEKTYQTHFQ